MTCAYALAAFTVSDHVELTHQDDVLVLDVNVLSAPDFLQHPASLLQVAALDQRVGRLWQQDAACKRHQTASKADKQEYSPMLTNRGPCSSLQ
jgi:hypothetical protein